MAHRNSWDISEQDDRSFGILRLFALADEPFTVQVKAIPQTWLHVNCPRLQEDKRRDGARDIICEESAVFCEAFHRCRLTGSIASINGGFSCENPADQTVPGYMRNSYTFKTFFFPFCYLQIFLPSNCSSRFLFHKAAACFFCVTSLSVKFLRWLSFNSAIHKICLKSISVICSGITSYKWRAVNVPRCQGVIFTFPLNARRLEIFQKKKKWQQKSSLCSVYVSLKSLWCNLNMILPPSPDKEFAQICLMCVVEQKMDRNLHLCVYVCLCVSVRTSSCAPLRHLISFVRLQQLFFFLYKTNSPHSVTAECCGSIKGGLVGEMSAIPLDCAQS